MATVVHKTTFKHLHSVHTSDYPTETWLIDPAGLAALEAAGIPSKHWKLNGGSTDVIEMTAQEKYDVDQAEPATVDAAVRLTVTADPQVTAVDAPKGSIIVWGHDHYCKEDDGSTTNVRRMGHMDKQDGTSGGTQLNLVSYSADPTPEKGDLWLREADGTIHLLHHDGTTTRVLAAEQSADILSVYASAFGAADEITPATPENLVKGCTLTAANENGSHWTIENAGGDTMELKYAGAQTKKFLVTAVFNFTADEDGNVFSVWLYKGATKQAASLAKAECVTGADGETMIVHHIIELAQNEALRLMIDAAATTPIVTPRSLVLTATPI